MRSGHAYAEGFTLHRREPGGYCRKQVRSNLLWGVALPLTALLLAFPTRGASLLLLCGYGWLGYRIFRAVRRHGAAHAHAKLYAAFCVLGKGPSAYGQLRYWWGRALGKRSTIIEYKQTTS
jgi:hypothetical protein